MTTTSTAPVDSAESETRRLAPSVFKGGAGVIDYLMRRNVGAKLTQEQATTLWDESAALLKSDGLGRTVREANQCKGGNLDTLPRGDVLDALARVLAGQRWPLNGASRQESQAFLEALVTEMKARGYQAWD